MTELPKWLSQDAMSAYGDGQSNESKDATESVEGEAEKVLEKLRQTIVLHLSIVKERGGDTGEAVRLWQEFNSSLFGSIADNGGNPSKAEALLTAGSVLLRKQNHAAEGLQNIDKELKKLGLERK